MISASGHFSLCVCSATEPLQLRQVDEFEASISTRPSAQPGS
jgi:hypothetical protein